MPTIDPTTQAITPKTVGGKTTIDRPDQFGGDTFMKLLVAQLKYQNPEKPTDPAEFLAQTAQFTMVEKLNTMATQTAALAASSQLANATSLIGKQVTYDDDGTANTSIVKSVSVDSTNGSVLVLASGAKIPLTKITAVNVPST